MKQARSARGRRSAPPPRRQAPPASAVPTAATRAAAQWTADRYGEPVHLVRPARAGHPAAVRDSELSEEQRGRILLTLEPRAASLDEVRTA